jgi:hypothetical protein
MKTGLAVIIMSLLFFGCSTTYVNRNPVGENFPTVEGQALTEESRKIPDYFEGSNVVLLLGYKQDSQFDIDRWLIGLDMTKTDVKVYELPTIQGLFPRMFQTAIDNGMRSGIPKEIWGGVITIYSGGAEVQEFTGNENPNNARVMLLDESGKVIYFHDRGFSVPALNELRESLKNAGSNLSGN